jgi:hypothetical protein
LKRGSQWVALFFGSSPNSGRRSEKSAAVFREDPLSWRAKAPALTETPKINYH